MAIEGLKTAGAAYQGSSPQTAVKAVELSAPTAKPAVKPAEGMVKPAVIDTAVAESGLKAQNTAENFEISDGKTQSPTEGLKRAVEEINKKEVNSEAIFGIHDSTNRVTIKIVDKETKEVLKEYPPEKTLDMIAKVWELAGLLVDEKR